MAKITYIVSKLEKAGFDVSVSERGRYYAHKSAGSIGYSISFYEQDGDGFNFYVKSDDAVDEPQTDYWAGSFRDNISQAIDSVDDSLDRGAARAAAHDAGECDGKSDRYAQPGYCSQCSAEHESGQCVGRCWSCQITAKNIVMQMGEEVAS